MNNVKPDVSVIVTSYTMARFNDLLELLACLQDQSYRNFETILVTERSTELYDKLKAHVRDQGWHNTTVLFNRGPYGLSAARNLGIKEARGDIITFTDDDALPYPEWLREIVQSFNSDDSVIGVTGPSYPLWENESMNWLPEEFYWMFSCMPDKSLDKEEVRNVWGVNMSFRREAFERCGAFSERFGIKGGGEKGWNAPGCEDTDFSMRVKSRTGKRVIFNPNVKVQHKVYCYRITNGFVARRAYWEGYAKATLSKYYHNGNNGRKVLSRELTLLQRIFLRLFPDIFGGFFRHPGISWRKLQITSIFLLCSAVGYLRGTMRSIGNTETARREIEA